MVRPIASGGTHRADLPHVAALETESCCWPGCEASLDLVDAPICWRHLLKATKITIEARLREWGSDQRRALARLTYLLEQSNALTWVYFIRLGDRVKIGFSTDPAKRVRALPHEEVLHLMPGTVDDERRLHAMFASYRVAGEWFEAAPDLLEYVRQLQQQDAAAS